MEKILKKINELLEYPEAQEVKNYLDLRISKNIQEKVKFGYFPNSNQIENLIFNEISSQELIELGLIYSKYIENNFSTQTLYFPFFENHPLIIPYYDVYGDLIALVGRTLLSASDQKTLKISKYKNTIFKKAQHLFGLNWAKEDILQKNHVYIVEGQIDIFSAMDKNINNVVAVGSSNLSELQLSLILRYTDNITICFDNDEAGEKGYNLIIDKYSKFANFNKLQLPDYYKDLDEYLQDGNSI